MPKEESLSTLDYASPMARPSRRLVPRSRVLFVCFFIASQIWLLAALLLWLGEKWERSDPAMYSFCGLGTWFDPVWYAVTNLATMAVALVFLVLAWKSRPVGDEN
jgi:hypothetical protein